MLTGKTQAFNWVTAERYESVLSNEYWFAIAFAGERGEGIIFPGILTGVDPNESS